MTGEEHRLDRSENALRKTGEEHRLDRLRYDTASNTPVSLYVLHLSRWADKVATEDATEGPDKRPLAKDAQTVVQKMQGPGRELERGKNLPIETSKQILDVPGYGLY